MYIEQQLAELTRVIQAGFDNLAEILRSQANPSTVVVSPPTLAPATVEATAETASAPVAEAAVEASKPTLSVVSGTTNGEDKTGLTFDQVNAIAQEVARLKSPPVAIDLIRKHGAGRLAEMDPKQYPAFVTACEVLLRKGEASL